MNDQSTLARVRTDQDEAPFEQSLRLLYHIRRDTSEESLNPCENGMSQTNWKLLSEKYPVGRAT